MILTEKSGFSFHYLSHTLIAVVHVVATHLPMIIEVLESILVSCNMTNEARPEDHGLKNYFKTFDTIVLLTVWMKVLQCIENRNVTLQAGDVLLDTVTNNIRALQGETVRPPW